MTGYEIACACGIPSLLLGYLTREIIKFGQELTYYRKGIRTLLHAKMYQTCMNFLDRGKVSHHDLEALEDLYECYHFFGMNGIGTELFERCKRLPIDEGGDNNG